MFGEYSALILCSVLCLVFISHTFVKSTSWNKQKMFISAQSDKLHNTDKKWSRSKQIICPWVQKNVVSDPATQRQQFVSFTFVVVKCFVLVLFNVSRTGPNWNMKTQLDILQ